MVRRATFVLVALALVLALASPAPASTGGVTAPPPADGRLEVVATELPLPVPDLPDAELEVDIEDINNRGQVVGTTGPWWHKQTLLWQRGQLRDLGANEPGHRPSINDRGQVATAVGGRAVVWRRGEVTDLGDASTSIIRDINERGEALVVRGAGTDDWSLRLWRDGAFTDIVTSSQEPGTELGLVALSDAGHVAGSVLSPECGSLLCERPFVWHDGTRTDLGYTGSVDGVTSSGQTIGRELAGFDDWHSVTWDDGETVRLPMLGGSDGGAMFINDRGQMVGHITDADGADAVMWDDGEVIELTTSLPPGNRALAINERGQVLIDGDQGLFLWDEGELVHLPGSWSNVPAVLNDRGQVAAGGEQPMLWTVRRRR